MGFCILTNNIDTSLVEDLDQSVRALRDSKQNVLVSGNNIKTINNQSLVGSGNVSIDVGVTRVNNTSPTNGNITLKTINSESLVGNSDIRVVKATGDTMTGNLNVHRSSGDLGFFSKNTSNNIELFCGVGAGGTNHGIWSQYLYKWLIHGDKDKNLYVGDINLTNAAAGRKSLQVNINEVCTSTDTNPGSTIGGNWTKVRTIRETKIVGVYGSPAEGTQVEEVNGTFISVTLPPDFYKSLGCHLNYWPKENWRNGAVVVIANDETLGASTPSKPAVVRLTTSAAQKYSLTIYLRYLSNDAIYVWKRS